MRGCIHFSFEAHLSSTLLTMELTELHWIRQLQYQACTTCSIRCCIPAKMSNVNIRFETDNRTSAECNVTPFITSNDIVTGKLDLRIYQMSTMLMRYVRHARKFNCQTNSCETSFNFTWNFICIYLSLYLFFYSKFLKYEWHWSAELEMISKYWSISCTFISNTCIPVF